IGFGSTKPTCYPRNMVIGKVARHFRGNDGRKDFDSVWMRLFDYRKPSVHCSAIGQKQPHDRQQTEPPCRWTQVVVYGHDTGNTVEVGQIFDACLVILQAGHKVDMHKQRQMLEM